jgi:predicted ester cyclase
MMPRFLQKSGAIFSTYLGYQNIHVCRDVMAMGLGYDERKKNESRRLTMSTEQNKANYRRFIEEAYNKGDLAVLDEIASPDLVLHFLPPGTPLGPESMKRVIASSRAAFPDICITFEDVFAVGDRIVARCTMTGTHQGPYMNHLGTLMPPTGKRFSVAGIDIWRFDGDGKWVECWSSLDRLGMLQQLDAIPASAPSPS